MSTNLFPVSRQGMRNLKKETDEINRLFMIDQIVKEISHSAYAYAKTCNKTKYKFSFDMMSKEFYIINIADIIAGVKNNFPDCSVSFDPSPLIVIVDWS